MHLSCCALVNHCCLTNHHKIQMYKAMTLISVSREFGISLTKCLWLGNSHEVTVRQWLGLWSSKISSFAYLGPQFRRIGQGLEEIGILRYLYIFVVLPHFSLVTSQQPGLFHSLSGIQRCVSWSYHILQENLKSHTGNLPPHSIDQGEKGN